MLRFLHFILIDPFEEGDLISRMLGVILWICVLFLAAIFLYGCYWVVDSSFMPVKQGYGTVVDRHIVPAHTTTTLMSTGKSLIPITTYHETTWNLTIEINGLTDEVSVDKSYYRQTDIGDKIHCHYTNGRIGQSLYIKSLD